jgi:hypothetical protein
MVLFVCVYIKVQGYILDYDETQAYTLYLIAFSPESQTLFPHQPIDVSLTAGSYAVYKYTPETTGTQKLFTSPFGGYGGSNDTVIELFTDAGLSNRIAINDDANATTTFSEIRANLNAGVAYYVKLRHYSSSGTVYARLNATVDQPPMLQLTLNQPQDVSFPAGSFFALQFTTPGTGHYKVFTDFYQGDSSNGYSDTVLTGFNDAQLTQPSTFNDDSNETVFSEQYLYTGSTGTMYYKLSGFNGGAVRARLQAVQLDQSFVTPVLGLNTPVDIAKGTGDAAYYDFTPEQSG